jgi:hypothetical protein
MLEHLGLDETSHTAMEALMTRAAADVARALSSTRDRDSRDGELIESLFLTVPVAS